MIDKCPIQTFWKFWTFQFDLDHFTWSMKISRCVQDEYEVLGPFSIRPLFYLRNKRIPHELAYGDVAGKPQTQHAAPKTREDRQITRPPRFWIIWLGLVAPRRLRLMRFELGSS